MLLILSLGLFPLGLIAILASIQSARQNRADRAEQIHAQIDLSAQKLNGAILRSVLTIRAASAAIASTPAQSPVCAETLQRLASETNGARARYALYGANGQLRCATPGYAPPPISRSTGGQRDQFSLLGTDTLRFILFDDSGNVEGLGEYPRAEVSRLAAVPGPFQNFDLALVQGDRAMPLFDNFQGGALVQSVQLIEPVVDGQLQLRIKAGAIPISAAELLMILLPVMMWLSAAIIGWLIVDRLLLRPLVRMQKVISAYQPGDSHLDIPTLATPAREIGELGQAFDQVTQTVARHEAELEAAVDRQTRLVREVHHRVKNNLQVVASLLNLHSRGSRNEEVAAAYASIQRRVDALAVVHRNHYAELEENRGVALRPLVSELTANLRATAPASASGMTISLNVEPYYVTQDVAVSVAFLITEIVEFAMFCSAGMVRISLAGGDSGTACLAIESESLRGETQCDPQLFERFDRVVTGLSRQLRSAMERDQENGRYALTIAVVEKGER